MAKLIVPELQELNYRKKWLENANTMAFHHGIIPFPKEEWKDFYHEWVEEPEDRYFAYIYCGGCEDFTGMVSYRYDEAQDGYVVDVLVDKSKRREGYGTSGIELMKEVAAENGIHRFVAPVEKGNDAAEFFEKTGFVKDRETDRELVYILDF